jgi:RHS repeat-associated protein
MLTSRRATVLCRYHYNALDHQVACTPSQEASVQRFYCKSRLATEIQDVINCSFFQYSHYVLAQQQRYKTMVETRLLATDQKRSVLSSCDGAGPQQLAYTPYGYCLPEQGVVSLLGFNGERQDLITGHYHLGNGYRQYNPVLMRFNSPDSLSPFGRGGINAYAALKSDPINHADPSGHSPIFNVVVAKAVNRFKSGLSTFKKLAAAASTDRQTVAAKSMKNRYWWNVKRELNNIAESRQALESIKTSMIGSADQLISAVSDQKFHYKYIYTDKGELIVGRVDPEWLLKHSTLAKLASSKRVVSAGHIAIRDRTVVLSNHTGHYYEKGVDTLDPVFNFLDRLGVHDYGLTVHALRHENLYGFIPFDYIPW